MCFACCLLLFLLTIPLVRTLVPSVALDATVVAFALSISDDSDNSTVVDLCHLANLITDLGVFSKKSLFWGGG